MLQAGSFTSVGKILSLIVSFSHNSRSTENIRARGIGISLFLHLLYNYHYLFISSNYAAMTGEMKNSGALDCEEISTFIVLIKQHFWKSFLGIIIMLRLERHQTFNGKVIPGLDKLWDDEFCRKRNIKKLQLSSYVGFRSVRNINDFDPLPCPRFSILDSSQNIYEPLSSNWSNYII